MGSLSNLVTTKYKLNLDDKNNNFKENEISGVNLSLGRREQYIFGVSLINVDGEFYKLVVAKDLENVNKQILRLGIIFMLLDILGSILLSLFNWKFSGIAIKPIKESKQKQNEFIAAASHELKSPVAVIQTNISALRIKKEDQDYLINSITGECQRMARLVSELLDLANMDAMNWPIHLEILEVETIILEVYEAFYETVVSQKREFKLSMPEEILPKVTCDRERIEQVLSILIDNAISYSNEHTPIELKVQAKQKHINIKVVDHGVGLSDKQKKQIFERFYRGEISRHEKNHYGLGLSIAYEIIKLHKGKLYVEDTTGGGCTFVVELPI